MPYFIKVKESDVAGPKKYTNERGNTECVEFVRQVTLAPGTTLWKQGASIKTAAIGTISRGTAIATFDDNGKYPVDGKGKHAAIYLSHTQAGVQVLDQWNGQGEVLPRQIRFNNPGKRSNNGDTFYVVE